MTANNSCPTGQRLIVSKETSSTSAGGGRNRYEKAQRCATMAFYQAGIEAKKSCHRNRLKGLVG